MAPLSQSCQFPALRFWCGHSCPCLWQNNLHNGGAIRDGPSLVQPQMISIGVTVASLFAAFPRIMGLRCLLCAAHLIPPAAKCGLDRFSGNRTPSTTTLALDLH